MFDQNSDKTLDGTERYTVDHNGAVLLSVLARIFKVESLRHLEVELNGSALPRSLDAVFEMKIDFGSVERTVALVDFVLYLHFLKSCL